MMTFHCAGRAALKKIPLPFPSARRLLPCLCAGLIVSAVHAGIRLRATAEPREATVGDPITYTLTLFTPPDVKIQPFAPEKELGPFEVMNFTSEKPVRDGNELRQNMVLRLALFDVGISTIPPVSLRCQTPDGRTQELSTPEIPIHVKSVLAADATDIRDIKGPVGIKPGWKTVLGLLPVLLLGGLGFALWNRFRQKESERTAAAPPRPPHETALEAFAQLETGLDLPAKVFYTRLADILRSYLEGRYALPALDRTTSEIFQEMRRNQFESSVCLQARDVLDTSDLVKFAKVEPAGEERRRDLQSARDLVLRARPPAPEPEETAVPAGVPTHG